MVEVLGGLRECHRQMRCDARMEAEGDPADGDVDEAVGAALDTANPHLGEGFDAATLLGVRCGGSTSRHGGTFADMEMKVKFIFIMAEPEIRVNGPRRDPRAAGSSALPGARRGGQRAANRRRRRDRLSVRPRADRLRADSTPEGTVRLAARASLAAAVLSASLLGGSAASAHGLGALVLGQGTKLVVGYFDEGTNAGSVRRFVFSNQTSGIYSFTDQPGWYVLRNGLPAGFAAPPAGLDVSFDFATLPNFGRNLLYWNGQGSVAFGQPPSGTGLLAQRPISGGFLTAIADGGLAPVAGFVMFRTTSASSFHSHVDFFLLGPNGNSQPAPDGIYLAALELRASGYTSGEQTYALFGKGVPESILDQAADWVDVNMVGDCTDRADNDGDGKVDFGAAPSNDPGCGGELTGFLEAPQCSDGIDNDADGKIDFPTDPECASLSDGAEAPGACGLLGLEALAVPGLVALRRRSRRPRT